MKILAVESSSSTASVAVLQDGILLGETSINNKKTHSQNLMLMLTELMIKLQLEPKDIDYYAASVGPGSFTGLRIGVSIIKGISFAADKPTVAVPTLDAMAMGLSNAKSIICPMIDARNNQVFTAIYKSDGEKLERLTEYLGITIDELLKLLKDYNSVIFTGDGSLLHYETLKKVKGLGCCFAKPGNNLNRAVDVALVATTLIHKGEIGDSMSLKPFYLRKSQAERMLELESGKKSKNV